MNFIPENKLDSVRVECQQNQEIPQVNPDGEVTPRLRMKHISHLDLDGYGATLLSEYVAKSFPEGYFYLETENILPSRLNEWMEKVISEIDTWDIVVVTDLSINKALIDMIKACKSPEKIHIFDHHEYDKTEIPDLPETVVVQQYVNGEDDKCDDPQGPLTCATALYHSFLKEDPIYDLIKFTSKTTGGDAANYFVECVRIYDTFEFWSTREDPENEQPFEYIEAPRLNTLFHILEREEFKEYIHDYLTNRKAQLTTSSDKYPYISEVLRLEAFKNKRYVDAALRRLIRTEFVCTLWRNGAAHDINYTIGVVFAEKNGPIIGNTACELHGEINFCVVVSNNQVSLYTNRKDVNVRDIAALFGGGGHAEAAGFTIPYSSANVFNIQHFFKIVECAGRLTPNGQFENVECVMPDSE